MGLIVTVDIFVFLAHKKKRHVSKSGMFRLSGSAPPYTFYYIKKSHKKVKAGVKS